MKSRVWAFLTVLATTTAVAAAVYVVAARKYPDIPSTLPLQVVADLPLSGHATRFDYASYDPKRHLLFIAHLGDSEVMVVDTRALREVDRIPDLRAVHGVLVIPELARVYATATGTNEVAVIDENSLRVTSRVPGGIYPDGIAYAPNAHKLYVSDESGRTDTVIDVRSNQRVATIPLAGEAGNTQYDSTSGHIFVNVQTRDQLAEIDPSTDKIVRWIDLSGAEGNHGLLIDAQQHLAFIACEGNDKLLVLNMRTMQITQSFSVGPTPDVLSYDAGIHHLYVAGEAGIVSVFKIDAGMASLAGMGWLAENAHVVAVDPETHRSYFPLKNVGGRPLLRVMEPHG